MAEDARRPGIEKGDKDLDSEGFTLAKWTLISSLETRAVPGESSFSILNDPRSTRNSNLDFNLISPGSKISRPFCPSLQPPALRGVKVRDKQKCRRDFSTEARPERTRSAGCDWSAVLPALWRATGSISQCRIGSAPKINVRKVPGAEDFGRPDPGLNKLFSSR